METSRAVFSQVDRRLGLGQLSDGRVESQLDLLVLLVRNGVFLHQPVHPFEVRLGVGMVGLGHGLGGLGLLELEPYGTGLELGQELALAHAVAFLDVDAGDLPARLGGDVDRVPGFERAGVGELLGDPFSLDLDDFDRSGPDGRRPGRRFPGGLFAGRDRGQQASRGYQDLRVSGFSLHPP